MYLAQSLLLVGILSKLWPLIKLITSGGIHKQVRLLNVYNMVSSDAKIMPSCQHNMCCKQ